MAMKIEATCSKAEPKKHSVRFYCDRVEDISLPFDSIYIYRLGMLEAGAVNGIPKKLKITIEEVTD